MYNSSYSQVCLSDGIESRQVEIMEHKPIHFSGAVRLEVSLAMVDAGVFWRFRYVDVE